MRRARLLLAAAALLPAPVFAQAAPTQAAPAAPAIKPDPAAPKGKLSDAAKPVAYRLDFTIDPESPRFTGHDEIDIQVKAPTAKLYMHGRDLTVTKAVATVAGKQIPATFTQVDQSGTARLDFASPLPAGAATLTFDYGGEFGDNSSGLYRIKVGDKYYSWTQFESIDARAAFPSFDEPGFKTPFTVSITTRPGYTTVSNAPESGVVKAGTMEKHSFAATKPLPTYLVALVTGPFTHVKGAIPADALRAAPLPLGAVATAPQKDKMAYVMAETPRIVQLLEQYFGQGFPFPKLDQIGSPVMPGAMENAGADIYGDDIIFLAPGATTGQKQTFGMVVAHELAHQWFGDLVTPAWWDDIWLNESFANWMGYRIGGEWRPELNIGVGGLEEGFSAMNTDSLEVGRAIHQPITENSQIDSAFDNITYGKGGHVIAMIAAYLGDEKFRDGVRLHLKRHAYGNANSEQFFASLADGAKDPRVLAAMKSFVDQQGVPLIDVTRSGGKLVATQSRYTFLGGKQAPTQWTVPFCYRVDAKKDCALIDKPSITLSAPGTGVLMPNAGGTGYYRFNLQPADWQALIASSASLSPAEGVATTDSLWAAFRAGKVPAAWLVKAAKVMAANPDAGVAVGGGARLAGLKSRGLIDAAAVPAYRRLLGTIYLPLLQKMGFDPRAGAYAADTPDRQQLRQQLVGLVAGGAEDKATTDTLVAAAEKYMAGDKAALDPAFIGMALGVYAERGGLPAAKKLIDLGAASEDPTVRRSALGAAAGSGHKDVATYILQLRDPRLRPFDQMALLFGLTGSEETRDMATDWLLANYEKLTAGGNGVFLTSRIPSAFGGACSVAKADQLEATLGPKVRAAGAGVLDYERVVEGIRHCAALKAAKGAEINAAITAG